MPTTKILHIVPDHSKFLKDALDMFDSIPGIENECWVVRKKAAPPVNLGIANANGVDYITFIEKCVNSVNHDIIIIHNLVSLPYNLVASINPNITVIWFSWGMDIYDYRFPEYPLIKLKNVIKSEKIKYHLSNILNLNYYRQILSKFIRNRFRPRKGFNDAISRIDYYSGVFPQEWEYLSLNKFFKAKQLLFNYSNPSSPFTSANLYDGLDCHRTNIQVGHSGYVFLNHKHIFRMLAKLDIRDTEKIISPLSYSASGDRYTQSVISYGKKIFGNKFEALTDFMPYNDYRNLMKSVKAAIFDIERQCAVGNCLIAIWNGAKVFFPKTSLNFKYFSGIGVKVYSIEDNLTSAELQTELDIDTIIKNRQQLIEYWNHENIRQRLIESLNSII